MQSDPRAPHVGAGAGRAQHLSGGAHEQYARMNAAPPSTCQGGVLFGGGKIFAADALRRRLIRERQRPYGIPVD
ncbi:hypothetical protein QFZ94_005766 [Paraburkholderia sp. JPY465]